MNDVETESTPVTDAELTNLLECAAKASPLPWYVGAHATGNTLDKYIVSYGQFEMLRMYNVIAEIDLDREDDFGFPGKDKCRANAELIRLACNLVPRLAEEVQGLRKENTNQAEVIRELREVIRETRDWLPDLLDAAERGITHTEYTQ